MKMIVAVVRDEYATTLTDQLNRKGIGATKLASTGGFLKAGNTTFMIGVPADQVDGVIELIRDSCPSKRSLRGDLTFSEGSLKGAATREGQPLPKEVAVGGATIFVLDVEQMLKV